MFDLSISGTSLAGTVANQITPLAGLFTWTGDSGLWFQAWLAGRAWLREGSGEVGGEAPGEGAGEGGGEGGEGGGEGGGEAGEGEGDRMRGIFDSPRNDETWTKQLERLDAAKDCCKKDDLLGNMDAHALAGRRLQVAAGTQSMAAILDQYYGAGAATGVDCRFHRFVAQRGPGDPVRAGQREPADCPARSSAQQAIHRHPVQRGPFAPQGAD